MDAQARTVQNILHSANQYMIPFFQRRYSWRRKNWKRLWQDVLALVGDSGTNQHFLGPLVCTPHEIVPGRVPAFQLIDGQQRVTTLTLLLAALRDAAKEHGDEALAEEITEDYLIHKHKPDLQRYKVVPRVEDREMLISLIEGSDGVEEAHPLTQAKMFLDKQIARHAKEDPAGALREVMTAVTARMSLVVITIEGENPYEIFESLNSTGTPLEESDLIRNFLFMQVPTDRQQAFHDKHWRPFESTFEETVD